MSNESPFDPFTTKGVLAFPEWVSDLSQMWHGFQIDTQLKAGLLKLAVPDDITLDALRSEHLKLSQDVIPLPDIDTPQSSSPNSAQEKSISQNGSLANPVKHIEDNFELWEHQDVHETRSEIKLISWDHFLDRKHEPAKSVYLSEAGVRVFDALLRNIAGRSGDTEEIRYAKLDQFLRALLDLALGRDSAFFEWDGMAGTFRKMDTDFTISGVSQQVLDQIAQKFISQGMKYRLLANFRSSRLCRGPLPLSFAGALQGILHAVENFVEDKLGNNLSLLRLQNTFGKPFDLIDAVYLIAEIFRTSADITQAVQNILNLGENGFVLNTKLEPIIGQVIGSILQPSLHAIGVKIGIVNSMIASHDQLAHTLDNLLSRRTANLFDSASATLQLLNKANPRKLTMIQSLSQISLDFCLTWDEVSQQQQQAGRYENVISHSLTSTISEAKRFPLEESFGNSQPRKSFGINTDNAFDLQSDLFDPDTSRTEILLYNGGRNIGDLVHSTFDANTEVLSTTRVSFRQALELSLLPILTAQHRLLSFAACQTLFLEHHLPEHLQSLYRFHSINDGPFSARLSMALFNSDQASGEGGRQTQMGSGLRLQNRDTWPPASSELRLVLMGILSESMSDVRNESVLQATSFAIRDLPDEELERCRDLNSIYALDFLCLHYKAPNLVLESVITAKALKRYDRIFMHLLRLLRVKDLAQYLLRQTCARNTPEHYSSAERKLRRDMHHFTTALANYSHNIAIKTNWHRFERQIQAIQRLLESNDYSGTLELASGLDHLRDMHEQTLNEISNALLLRKKQKEARTVVEDIFSIILQYAAIDLTTHNQDGSDNIAKRSVTTLQTKFDTKVRYFVGYLRSISAAQTGDEDRQMAEQLLLSLDHAGYYTKKRDGPVTDL